jgi:predicted transcriptional regulator
MANTKSIQKVLDYLKTREEAVSPSEICFNLTLKYRTVKEVLEILKMNNQVIILTAEKGASLVKFTGDKNDNPNTTRTR